MHASHPVDPNGSTDQDTRRHFHDCDSLLASIGSPGRCSAFFKATFWHSNESALALDKYIERGSGPAMRNTGDEIIKVLNVTKNMRPLRDNDSNIARS